MHFKRLKLHSNVVFTNIYGLEMEVVGLQKIINTFYLICRSTSIQIIQFINCILQAWIVKV
jgi:hypothetical protein